MYVQLKTIKSDFTYKVWKADFTYDELQSFKDNELEAADFCEKRGLVYDQTRQRLPQPHSNGPFFTCISTFEGS